MDRQRFIMRAGMEAESPGVCSRPAGGPESAGSLWARGWRHPLSGEDRPPCSIQALDISDKAHPHRRAICFPLPTDLC